MLYSVEFVINGTSTVGSMCYVGTSFDVLIFYIYDTRPKIRPQNNRFHHVIATCSHYGDHTRSFCLLPNHISLTYSFYFSHTTSQNFVNTTENPS